MVDGGATSKNGLGNGSAYPYAALVPATKCERILIVLLTVAVVIIPARIIVQRWRTANENSSAKHTLQIALEDVNRLYASEHGYTAPSQFGRLLWPYLNRSDPSLKWGKESVSPTQVAVARSFYGRRQSIELSVYSYAGVCWVAMSIRAVTSVALRVDRSLHGPGTYFGANRATRCGPVYLTPPASGWLHSLRQVKP